MRQCSNQADLGQQCTRLSKWLVMRTWEGDEILVGHDVDSGDSHISPAMASFNCRLRQARAQCGQRYVLLGPPDRDAHAGYAWQCWMAINERVECFDITEVVLAGQTSVGHRG